MRALKLLAACFALFAVAPAYALNNISYVDGNASNNNQTCEAQAPCPLLISALNQTNEGGTIVCAGPTQYFAIIINKALTIDCSAAPLSINTIGGADTGIEIDIPSNKTLRTVRLIGVRVYGNASGQKSLTHGIVLKSATEVYMDSVRVEGVISRGVWDARTGGQTKLFMKNTDIRDSGLAGIVAGAQAVGIVALDNVTLTNNGYGIAAASGNNVFVDRSIISGNKTSGVEADPGGQVEVINSALTHNAVNVQAYGTIRLRESDIKFSNTAIQGGAAVSMGANRFSGNGAIGVTPPLATGAPADVFN